MSTSEQVKLPKLPHGEGTMSYDYNKPKSPDYRLPDSAGDQSDLYKEQENCDSKGIQERFCGGKEAENSEEVLCKDPHMHDREKGEILFTLVEGRGGYCEIMCTK